MLMVAGSFGRVSVPLTWGYPEKSPSPTSKTPCKKQGSPERRVSEQPRDAVAIPLAIRLVIGHLIPELKIDGLGLIDCHIMAL